MEAKNILNRSVLIVVAPLLILCSLYLLTLTSEFQNGNEQFINAISLDLILTIPIVYLMLIWNTKISKYTAVPIGIFGLFIGLKFIPEANQGLLIFIFHWVLPIIELTVFTLVLLKIRRLRKVYKQNSSYDFYDAIKIASKEITPTKFSHFLATEIACIYYGILKWKQKKITFNDFTYHKNSGIQALLYIMIFIVGVELFVFHILLVENHPIFAWVLTFLSAYSALQLLAFGKSTSQRPYKLTANKIILNYGILSAAELDFSNIESIEKSKMNVELTDTIKTLSPFGLIDAHNTHIKLKSSVVFESLYGFKKEAKELLIFVDNREEFIKRINSKTQ